MALRIRRNEIIVTPAECQAGLSEAYSICSYRRSESKRIDNHSAESFDRNLLLRLATERVVNLEHATISFVGKPSNI